MRKRSYKEKRPLGAMAARQRETRPSYERILLRFGLLSDKINLQEAYGVWQRVCADPLVLKLAMVLDAEDKPAYLASVTAPYRCHGAQACWQR